MVADALRSTLDSLQLDPSVQEDRHYLITMLRRLGYTEIEIRQALGELAPVQEEPVQEESVQEDPAEVETKTTTVELEYNEDPAEGLQDFEPVTPARNAAFVVQQEPEPEEEVNFEELEDEHAEFELIEAEDAEAEEVQFEEIQAAPGKRVRLRVIRAESPEEAADIARSQGHDVKHTVPVNVRSQAEPVDSWETPEFEHEDGAVGGDHWEWQEPTEEPEASTWDAAEEASWEEPADTAWPEETPLKQTEPEESVWEVEPTPEMAPALDAEPESNWDSVEENAWDEPKPVTNELETIAWDAPEPAPEAPGLREIAPEPTNFAAPDVVEGGPAITPVPKGAYYQRNDYVLHMRKAKLPSGKSETLYFFAKGVSDSGTPIELPEGYVVREHPGSKLPYIVREDA